LTFAFPGVMPEAMAANANLYVSAENSQFSNYMTGPQVVEVVVIDDDIDETNESNGEPDVTINGAKLRMAQATDGNWYGYFADATQAKRADGTTDDAMGGYGLDFGQFCARTSTFTASDQTTQMFSDTVGVALPIRSNSTTSTYGTNGTTTLVACNTDVAALGTRSVMITANSTHLNSRQNIENGDGAVPSTNTSGVETTVMNVRKRSKENQHSNGRFHRNRTNWIR